MMSIIEHITYTRYFLILTTTPVGKNYNNVYFLQLKKKNLLLTHFYLSYLVITIITLFLVSKEPETEDK